MKKRKLLMVGLFAFFSFGLCAFASVNSMRTEPVIAEEVPPEEDDDGELVIINSTDIAQEAAEETTNKFKKIWETYLLPAILSVNLSSIAAAVVSVAFAIKNHKNHKDYKKQVDFVVDVVLKLLEAITNYIQLLEARNAQTAELVSKLDDTIAVVNNLMLQIDKNNVHFEKLKQANLGLINIETEIVKNNPDYVKNGLSSKVVEIKDIILSLK